MMLKKFRCLALVLGLILVVVSCTTFAAVKPIKLVFGHIWPADHYLSKGDLYFKELVEKNSKGRILIDYYPAGQLGNGPELLQATKTGAQQLLLSSGSGLVTCWSKLGTLNLPYIFRDNMHAMKVANKLPFLIGQNELADKVGVRILNVRPLPARHLTTKIPINKLEDIKGIKIRVPENPISLALWRALGAIPTVIPAADTYTALATGTVDAQENPFIDIYTRKFNEQTKYCALTSHVQEVVMMLINNKCWNELTKAQKRILTNAAAKSAKKGEKDYIKSDKKNYDVLVKAGMKFTKPDLTAFREKAKTIWNQFGDQGLINKIEAVK
jgi:tripartite ATP-independent transporter DctP family solute receptor